MDVRDAEGRPHGAGVDGRRGARRLDGGHPHRRFNARALRPARRRQARTPDRSDVSARGPRVAHLHVRCAGAHVAGGPRGQVLRHDLHRIGPRRGPGAQRGLHPHHRRDAVRDVRRRARGRDAAAARHFRAASRTDGTDACREPEPADRDARRQTRPRRDWRAGGRLQLDAGPVAGARSGTAGTPERAGADCRRPDRGSAGGQYGARSKRATRRWKRAARKASSSPT